MFCSVFFRFMFVNFCVLIVVFRFVDEIVWFLLFFDLMV